MRKIVRHTLVELEADQCCAEEGASQRFCCDSQCNQGRDCPARKDEPPSNVGMWLGALTVLLVAAGGALVLVMQGAPK